MSRGLKIAEPPRRRATERKGEKLDTPANESRAGDTAMPTSEKFSQVREGEKVQFNKRVTRGVADGYEILAIKTHKKIPDLLAEALELLETKYGKT